MSVTPRVALESYDSADWHENHIDEQIRANLHKASSPALIRQVYPFRARLISKCLFSHKTVGQILDYARTAWEPSLYPIQVWDAEGTAKPHVWRYTSSEVEILPAD